jgi:hypothetical protein
MEAVASDARICGKTTIDLKWTAHAPANHFYKSIGYHQKNQGMNPWFFIIRIKAISAAERLMAAGPQQSGGAEAKDQDLEDDEH